MMLFIVFASDKWQLIIKLIKVIETLVYDSLETNKWQRLSSSYQANSLFLLIRVFKMIRTIFCKQ